MLVATLIGLALSASFATAQRTYQSAPRFVPLVDGSENFRASFVAIDSDGTVYVADDINGMILKMSPGEPLTKLTAFFAPSSNQRIPAVFDHPTGLAVGRDRSVYVATFDRLYRIAPDGLTTLLASGREFVAGIAADFDGHVYFSETSRHVVHRISRDGILTTFAGKLGEAGSADGGEAARFSHPTGLAVDSSGTVYVADSGNASIRKISADGIVSTMAGPAGISASSEGIGSIAPLTDPYAIAVDGSGSVYVTRSNGATGEGYRIRQVTSDGAVTTLIESGGFGYVVEAGTLSSIAVDPHGRLYVVDGWYGALLVDSAPPVFLAHLPGQSVAPGGTATFSAPAPGYQPMSYQWFKDGVPLAGENSASLTISQVQAADLGTYTLVATNASGSATSNPAALTFLSAANRITNFAIRSNAGNGPQTIIVGFVVGGGSTTATTPLLIRGVGPTLEGFGVPTFLADPMLTLFSGSTAVASNDNWNGDPQVSTIGAHVGAFGLISTTSRDAALYHPHLSSGAHTVHLSGIGTTTGVGLVEIYDASSSDVSSGFAPRLINISARTQVGTGASILIAGFNIGGTAAKTLLIRAIGPTLNVFGVAEALSDPKLDLHRGSSVIGSNDNWDGDALISSVAAEVGAFALDPASRDSGMLATLQPGSYTVHVSGVANTTGIALVEIYEVR
jgi:sugar lactone lactonase YvrE